MNFNWNEFSLNLYLWSQVSVESRLSPHSVSLRVKTISSSTVWVKTTFATKILCFLYWNPINNWSALQIYRNLSFVWLRCALRLAIDVFINSKLLTWNPNTMKDSKMDFISFVWIEWQIMETKESILCLEYNSYFMCQSNDRIILISDTHSELWNAFQSSIPVYCLLPDIRVAFVLNAILLFVSYKRLRYKLKNRLQHKIDCRELISHAMHTNSKSITNNTRLSIRISKEKKTSKHRIKEFYFEVNYIWITIIRELSLIPFIARSLWDSFGVWDHLVVIWFSD